jgi:hypothetical protein
MTPTTVVLSSTPPAHNSENLTGDCKVESQLSDKFSLGSTLSVGGDADLPIRNVRKSLNRQERREMKFHYTSLMFFVLTG